ncbi:MAG: hypothetical protein HRF45_03450 [Fimbriimonadia bacterium]|jgi:hypothetical protein
MSPLLTAVALLLGVSEIRVVVIGEVQVPGEHVLPAGASLLHALDAAGGMLQSADTSRVTLQRKNSTDLIPIDLTRLTRLGDPAQNYELRDGDRIVILRQARSSVWIRSGSVMRPVEFEPGLIALEALRRAHWLATGDSDRIRIERWMPSGAPVRYEYTVRQLLSAEPDVQKLQPGDVIYVSRGSLRDGEERGGDDGK